MHFIQTRNIEQTLVLKIEETKWKRTTQAEKRSLQTHSHHANRAFPLNTWACALRSMFFSSHDSNKFRAIIFATAIMRKYGKMKSRSNAVNWHNLVVVQYAANDCQMQFDPDTYIWMQIFRKTLDALIDESSFPCWAVDAEMQHANDCN